MYHGTVYPDITGVVGRTPMIRLARLAPDLGATRLLLKLEFCNPLSSVKDRIARAMIEAGERDDRIRPGHTHLIEPTSGNTGIALAFVAAAKGYRLTLTMPESMSHERRALLRGLGAELVLTPGEDGMRGAMARAEELLAATPNAWSPRQFENPANPAFHEEPTGPEIWNDTAGRVDLLVAGVGTGGTITGCTRYLRRHNPHLRSIAVEPAESPVLTGGRAGAHAIQGIGPGFVPANLDRRAVSAVEAVSSDEAFRWARKLAEREGVPAGISTGANVAVAVRLARRPENHGLTIVTFACSSAERYLSTPLYRLIGARLVDEREPVAQEVPA